MPIYLATPNQTFTIQQITGTDKTKLHLQNLGFVIGETITLIGKMDDNVIVKIKGISMAIGRDLAKRILV